MLLCGILIGLKHFHFLTIHKLHHLISLPLLETEPQPLMTVIFIVGLILVVLDLDKVAVYRSGVKGEGDEGVDGGGFGDDFEGP